MNRKSRAICLALTLATLAWALPACTTASTADRNETSDPSSSKRDSDREQTKITLPTGTPLRVVLQQGVGTDSSTSGSQFSAVLADPVVVDGRTVLEKGAAVVGRVTDIQKSGRVKGRATLSLRLVSLSHHGKSVPITTQTYVGVARSTHKRDAATIGGGAGVGAAIGAIAGGGKGALTGAAIGGAGGTGVVLATRGEDVHYPPESRLRFVLAQSVDL